MFRNPMVAFAAYMAGFVFLEDFLHSSNQQSEANMGSLMDLMVAIGHQNTVTASLAVQMAYSIRKAGIDASAVDKVCIVQRGIMKRTNPVVGQASNGQDGAQGAVDGAAE